MGSLQLQDPRLLLKRFDTIQKKNIMGSLQSKIDIHCLFKLIVAHSVCCASSYVVHLGLKGHGNQRQASQEMGKQNVHMHFICVP